MPYIHVKADEILPGDQFRKMAPNGSPGDRVRVISCCHEGPTNDRRVTLTTTGGSSFRYYADHGFVVLRGES
jgi:hypothetical protein